jgi:hypothetical protein
MKTNTPITPFQFFRRHAGFSYNAQTETKAQGRARCARELVAAELRGRDIGLSFSWSIDPDTDSSDFCDDNPHWSLWQCLAYDANGQIVASLGGVDFGRNETPHSDPYRRVVEAELASEVLARGE